MAHEVRGFESEVTSLEDAAAKASEKTLKDQEQRFDSAVREITQSITSMSHENTLVQIDGKSENVVINPSVFATKIADFDKLIELLKMTHLEQETLDFFLRYTISSTDFLQLKTTYDAQYVELENSVKELESNIEEAHDRRIDGIKCQISNDGEKLTRNQDAVNELYLETTDILDNCEQLIGELESLRKEKEHRRQQAEQSEEPLTKVQEKWEEMRRSRIDYENLKAQTTQLEAIKRDHEQRKVPTKLKQDPKLNELGCTLDSLIRLWESSFLPNAGWHDLEVYPQTRKFQFDVSDVFTVLIALDDRRRINDITIHRKEDRGIRVDVDLQLELKQQNVGSRDIYKSMERITECLHGQSHMK